MSEVKGWPRDSCSKVPHDRFNPAITAASSGLIPRSRFISP